MTESIIRSRTNPLVKRLRALKDRGAGSDLALLEEMGFDVLAFESGLYDCRRAWRATPS